MVIEVVYALPGGYDVICVTLEPGASAADAVCHSGMVCRHPEIEWPGAPVGIFGRRVAPQALLADGDRVEIYRPLLLDPKLRRRRRAQARPRQV